MRKFLRRLTLLLLIVGAVVAWFGYGEYQRFADAPLTMGAKEQTLDVELGTPFTRIVAMLHRRGLTHAHPLYWRVLAWQMGVADGLHAGEYALSYGLTPRRLLQRMARGDVIQHRFTIIEGWTARELRGALAREPALKQTINAMGDEELMAKLGAAGLQPEGRFLPETYAYTKGGSDFDVLKRAFLAQQAATQRAWEKRVPDLPLKSAEEALILASIVEKETGRAAERPRIAGVFLRRLRLGMRLQTDPTVIYGLGPSFDGNLTRKHLETDTPYNTYTRFGLPPTPIALPGKAALDAATHPAAGDELYFVARGDGSHEFSANLREHEAAIRKYIFKRR